MYLSSKTNPYLDMYLNTPSFTLYTLRHRLGRPFLIFAVAADDFSSFFLFKVFLY